MAYQTSATSPIATGSGNNLTGTKPSGTVAGDTLVAFLSQDGAPPSTWTPPASWTLANNNDQSTPDGACNRVYWLTAGASEPSTYTWASPTSSSADIVILRFSGRDQVAPIRFITPTQVTSAAASPINAGLASGTAVAGDDLVWGIAMDFAAGPDDFSLGAGASGFTVRENTQGPPWTSVHAMTKDNVGAGAVGTVTGVMSFTAPTAAYSGWVIALKAGAAPAAKPAGFKKWLLSQLLGGAPATPPVFGGTSSLTISWDLPTTNPDGTALGGAITDIRVSYDTVSRVGTGVDYANSVLVGSGSATSLVLTGLASGVPIFAAVSVIVGGVEGDYGLESTGTPP